MNKKLEHIDQVPTAPTPSLVLAATPEDVGLNKHAWVRPICICIGVIAASIAAVKIAEQPDGADKLKGFAGAISAIVTLAELA